MYDCIRLDPEKFSPGQWEEFYRLREELHLRYHAPFTSGAENFKSGILHAIHKNGFTIYIFSLHGKMTGFASYWVMNPGHPAAQNNVVQCVIPDEHMNAGSQRAVLQCVLHKMQTEGHAKCLWRTSQPALARLLQETGAMPSNLGCWFRLNPQEAEPDLVQKWIREVDLSSLGLRCEFAGFLPEHLVEETAAVSNLLVNDMVREDTSVSFHVSAGYLRNVMEGARLTGQLPLHLFLRDSANKLIGLSVLNKGEQKLTGIIPEWRGRGLARWLKASMLNIVKNDYKQVTLVNTECFSKNEPMIRINKNLGFELYKTDHDFYTTPSLLESFLNAD
jgi:GNAT superfamily N-acetyltransferase